MGQVTISERIEAGRRERRVLTLVSRAGWRLEQAERERTWALVSARAEGISIRTLATAVGLSGWPVTRRPPRSGAGPSAPAGPAFGAGLWHGPAPLAVRAHCR